MPEKSKGHPIAAILLFLSGAFCNVVGIAELCVAIQKIVGKQPLSFEPIASAMLLSMGIFALSYAAQLWKD